MSPVNLVSTNVWRVTPELVLALQHRLRPPVDSYLNGSQTWLVDHPPAAGEGGEAITLEWRLHPVARYLVPESLSHYDLWEQVVSQLSAGVPPTSLELGTEIRALDGIWDGLECFAAYGDEIEPSILAGWATEMLGIAPEAFGLVDHQAIGDQWSNDNGAVSIIELLFLQLQT